MLDYIRMLTITSAGAAENDNQSRMSFRIGRLRLCLHPPITKTRGIAGLRDSRTFKASTSRRINDIEFSGERLSIIKTKRRGSAEFPAFGNSAGFLEGGTAEFERRNSALPGLIAITKTRQGLTQTCGKRQVGVGGEANGLERRAKKSQNGETNPLWCLESTS